MEDNASAAAVLGFLQRYLEDREAGRERTLEEYQALFPGHEPAIARKHAELLASVDASEAERGTKATATNGRIGRFRILEEIGRGGQGVVYLAEDPELHRRVALKVLSFGLGLSPEAQRRFQREAETASRIEHPGICAVYEIGQADGLSFIAMQYVEGESLARKIADAKASRRTRLALSETTPSLGRAQPSQPRSQPSEIVAVVRLIERVARALHTAHEAGIVHRDIKPANIRVTHQGEPVLLDFGLARDDRSEEPSLTQTSEILGTPAYMSPEQLQAGRKSIDRRTDVYSLAVTLYECLTLRRPFEAPTREGLYRSILDEEPTSVRTLNPRVPRDLAVILDTALQKNPDHRFLTALDFADELARVCERRPILTRRTGPLVRTWRWAQRNPYLASALGGLVLVLALGLAVTGYLLEEARIALSSFRVALGNFDGLALIQKLDDAEAALKEVYPVGPDKVAALESWLRDHWAPIESGWPDVTAILARLKGGEVQGRDLFLRDTLSKLEKRLREFGEGPASAAVFAREDLAWSRIVARETIDAHADLWRATREAIAGSPLYRGLQLPDQLGLIPLGPDPDSGLFEFYHLRSATPGSPLPARDPASGRIRMTDEMGIVFVLLPGKKQLVGAQKDDPTRPNYVANAETKELELHERIIDPFFLSKFELTQGQWIRLSHKKNLAEFPAGTRHFGSEITLAYPADRLSLDDLLLGREGFRIPTEEEWEYACRAGTDTPWYTGSSAGTLHGYENVGDRTAGEQVPEWDGGDDIEPDGHVIYAPVGSFEPNPFGLHDMHGNVAESCRSWSTDGTTIVARGGSFRTDARTSSSTIRRFVWPDHGNGLRPTRDIKPGLFTEPRPGHSWRIGSHPIPFDMDGDGLSDVFAYAYVEGEADADHGYLLHNAGARRFEDVTSTHLPKGMDPVRAAATADVDGDGDVDLMAAQGCRVSAQCRLYKNDGAGNLADETVTHVPQREDSTAALGFGDFDGDGDADLYLGTVGGDKGEPNRLYLNGGSGRFQDVTLTHLPQTGDQVQDRTGAVAHCDVDRDGDLDVFCGNWHYRYQNRLFLNDGSAHFTDVTADHVPPMHIDRSGIFGDITRSVVFGDLDGDGDEDLACGNGWGVRWQRNRLYFNDGAGRFVDVSDTNLPEDQETTYVLALGDIDGDGDLDLFSANASGHTFGARDRMYFNDGKCRFRDVSTTHCPNIAGRGLALIDVDLDQDLDLFLEDGSFLRLFLNRSRP
jgi:formylglycine-generating enzyme required for sulfatase activity/tRNA A-37 threonylcarbamoyl transferase component Bud32